MGDLKFGSLLFGGGSRGGVIGCTGSQNPPAQTVDGSIGSHDNDAKEDVGLAGPPNDTGFPDIIPFLDVAVKPEISIVDCLSSDWSQIKWLNGQIGLAGLVDSYKDDGTDRAYLYDQSLAVIAFTQAGEKCQAREILAKLASLQSQTGSWPTCYSAVDASLCESFVHTGPIAWIVLAVNFYEAKTADLQFSPMAEKALGWLDTMIITSGEAVGALKYGEGYSVISTEHNHDAYSAYLFRGQATEAASIKSFLINEQWAAAPTSNGPYHNVEIFWRGYNDFAWCSDSQTWGVLALGDTYAKSLEWIDQSGYGYGSTKTSQQGVTGVSFCTEDLNVDKCGKLVVWLEGTEQLAAAYYSVGENSKGDFYHHQTQTVVASSGGVPHSLAEAGDPINWPCNWPYESVAATLWYYFNEEKINPFKP